MSFRPAATAFVAAMLFACALPTQARAEQKKVRPQDNFAIIFCTVWDSHNRPVYGVPVRVRRADEKKWRWQAKSDHRGEFGVHVPVGDHEYILQADIKTPKGKPKPETRVHISGDERIDTSLHLAE
jgi:hypothetical protein